ncbi:MAG: hypothetical protein ACOY0T_32965 [Myxococcota bacterium]
MVAHSLPLSRSTRPQGVGRGGVGAGSWMALVAATTIGLSAVQRVRAAVTVGSRESLPSVSGEYRLIVQSYSASNVVDGRPLAHARPLASAQRSVTPEELARGVDVDVVDVGEPANDSAVIVAWLERGSADLDFDGRRARPSSDAYIGVAAAHREEARVVLSRKSA